jgi:hypothetical protein
MRIGPVMYSKKEESLFFKSYALGLFVGLPFTVVLFSLFPPSANKPSDFVGWMFLFSQFLSKLVIPWFSITAIVSAVQFQRNGIMHSTSSFFKLIWALFCAFAVMFSYVVLILAALFVPIYEGAVWLDLVRRFWLCTLLFLPFLFLFFLIFIPDLPPRRMVSHAGLVLQGKEAFPKIGLRPTIEAAFLAIYLLVVFLPFPNPYGVVDIFIIGGGVAASMILYKDRFQRKINRKK